MKKKLILLAVLIIIIGVGLGVYLNKTLILNKIKTTILENIETKIGRTISVDKIDYNIFKGFVINGLEISEKTSEGTIPFLKANEITFQPILFPFIFKKNIMIPSINVNSLSANVIRVEKNTWNFSDLIELAAISPKTESKFSLTVLKVKINNSQILFQDKTLSTPFSKKLENLNLAIKPVLPTSVKFDLKTNIENTESQIALDGKINLSTKTLETSIKIKDLVIVDYLFYFNNLPFSIKKGSFSSELIASFKDGQLNLKGKSIFDNLEILKDTIQIQANLASDYKFSYDSKNQTNPFYYEIDLDVSNAKLLGINYIKEVNDINANFNIRPDKITCDVFSAAILENPLRLSGSMENTNNPYFNAKINSSFAISKLKELLKDKINLEKIQIEGDSEIEVDIKGLAWDRKSWDFKGDIKVSNAKLKADYLPDEIKNIQADISFDKTNASWKNLTASFKGETYNSHGSLNNFLNPQVQFNLSSAALGFETEFNMKKELLEITRLNGNYLKSQFDIAGNIDISEKNAPLLDLEVTAKIELEDLGNLNPKLKETFDIIKLSGQLNTQARLNGRLRDYQNWQLILNATSPLLSIYGLKINDVNLDFAQESSPLINLQVTAQAYSGKILAKHQADLSETDIPFVSNIIINDVDISQLKNDTALKQKDISGIFQAESNLKGTTKNIQDSLNGALKLRIDNGNLWQMELFKGIGELLLIPEFQKIVFNEASGDFVIENEKVSTNNLMLESEKVNILCEGELDFSGNINFDATIQMAEGLIKDMADVKGILSSILAQSTNAIGIKLSGTLQNPKFKIIPIPTKIFKKAKEFIFEDVIGDVLEDIAK